MAQPRIGLLAVDLGSLDQAVDLCAGRGAFRRVTEQPGFTSDNKRLYRTLRQVVVDRQVAGLDVAFQPAPVVRQIVHRLTQHALWRDLSVRLVQPAFQLSQNRQALFLTTDKSLIVATILQFTLDAVQLVDHLQRDIGTSGLALGLHFLCFEKFAPRMGHARHARLQRQRVIACVIISHHIAAITFQQA